MKVPASTTNFEVGLEMTYFHPFFFAKCVADSTSLNVSWREGMERVRVRKKESQRDREREGQR